MTKNFREQNERERLTRTGNHVCWDKKFSGQRAMALSALFSENGLPDLPVILIEPHRNQQGVLQIDFYYADNEPISMNSIQASGLARNLNQLDEVQLADEIYGALRLQFQTVNCQRETDSARLSGLVTAERRARLVQMLLGPRHLPDRPRTKSQGNEFGKMSGVVCWPLLQNAISSSRLRSQSSRMSALIKSAKSSVGLPLV